MRTNLPNLLTLTRIVLILPFALLVFSADPWAHWVALALFSIAGATDWLDGYLARRLNSGSALGRMLDPIADKLLIGAALLVLAANGRIAGWQIAAALAILLREIGVSGLREYLGSLGIGVPVTNLAKWKTAAQMVALGFFIAPSVATALDFLGVALLWGAAVLTIVTGWGYLTTARSALVPAPATRRPEPATPPGAPARQA